MKINPEYIKKYIPSLLLPFVRYLYCLYQEYRTRLISKKYSLNIHTINKKKHILIYGVAALWMWGTEKNLQMIAKYLDREKYEIYFMYGTQPRKLWNYNKDMIEKRREYLWDWNITYIPFDYEKLSENHPYEITGMMPHIVDVIKYHAIDLVITAWPGNAEFPLTDIQCPIIFLNIFGIPNTIKNIRYHICISQTIADEISDIVPKEKIKPLYIPTEWPGNMTSQIEWVEFRKKHNIPLDALVFWRIWRADDSIYDPIGIEAFRSSVKKHDNIYYVIVSPSPLLREYIRCHVIKNIVLIEPIYDEREVWKFHLSIDVLAHFRYDWETFGLNIAESMICGNPIITHKSKIWNAHLEYLNSDNSFISEIDDVHSYSKAMEYFATDSMGQKRREMWNNAKKIANKLFHIDSYISKVEDLIDSLYL